METQWRAAQAGQPWLPTAPQQCRHRWGFWGVTELFFLERIRYSWSKIFLKSTKKHKGSAPSINNSKFPLFPLFHEPISHTLIMTLFLLQNKPLPWPDFLLQLSSKAVLLSFTSFHAPCSSSHLFTQIQHYSLFFQIHHVKYLTGKCFQMSPKLKKHSNIMPVSCLFLHVAMH